MTIDLNDAEGQSDRNPIPAGVYQLEAHVKAGSAGPDGLLKTAKNLRSLMLVLECTVLAEVQQGKIVPSDHAKRRIWDYITVDFDESDHPALPPLEAGDKLDKYKTSVRMGRAKLRAILDSAFALDPNDHSEAAQDKRRLETYAELDQLRFFAEVKIRDANGKYGPSNAIDYIITPDLPDYPKSSGKAVAMAAKSAMPKPSYRDDLNDEIPF